jgi:signal transduction histidine kinase
MKAFTLELLVPLDIDYTYTFTAIDKNKKLSVPFRQNVYLIFKEAMVNIIKHAGAGKVDIVLTANRKSLQMRISDDGKGFSAMTNTRGRGVKNMYKRAKEIGGSLLIEEGEIGGTVLVLNAPF